jgi:hypothetical protein
MRSSMNSNLVYGDKTRDVATLKTVLGNFEEQVKMLTVESPIKKNNDNP